jgi:hypothetical protein
MKANYIFSGLIGLLALGASTAHAEGNFDGTYEMEYKVVSVGLFCGFASETEILFKNVRFVADVSEEGDEVEAAINDQLNARLAHIAEAGLSPAEQELAIADAEAYFWWLQDVAELLVVRYPDTLILDAQWTPFPTPHHYTADAFLVDDDGIGYVIARDAIVGTQSGKFALQPFARVETWTTDSLTINVALAAQMAGNLETGIGAFRARAQRLVFDEGSNEVWGCSLSNVAGFELEDEAEEPDGETALDATAVRLDPKNAYLFRTQLHRAAMRDLTQQEGRLSGTMGTQAAKLSWLLTR